MSAVLWNINMQQSTNFITVVNIMMVGLYICLNHRRDQFSILEFLRTQPQ
jgi:hypothetical protein